MSIEALVSVEWLKDHLGDPNVRPIDVRWYLMERGRGHTEYLADHIPGAVYMDVDGDLAAPRGQGPGRHPLPTATAFASAAGRAGIGPDTHVNRLRRQRRCLRGAAVVAAALLRPHARLAA